MEEESAVRFLRLAATSASLAPPLKSIADTVLEITTLVMKFKTCASGWTEFRAYIEGAVATVLRSVKATDVEQPEMQGPVEQLLRTLREVSKRIKARHSDPVWLQLRHFLDHPVMICEMRQQVDDAVELFKLGTTVRIHLGTGRTLQPVDKHNTVDPLLAKLHYVRGASWDPNRVCLPETRQKIIESAFSWINTPHEMTKTNIFLLTGVAGAGKSAIAHTVSQRLSERKQLLTSFFFDRETPQRNNPKHLISTIATDLSCRERGLASRIISVIQDDESLIGAPIARQFRDLILDPTADCRCEHPLVIVLDALDEGCDMDLLQILSERARELPHFIRIFITSRMTPETEKLRRKSHVHSASLEIYTDDNSSDISIYISHKLKQVADSQLLGDDWPDQQLVHSFQAKAGGLFLWVATTCDYLSACYNAQRELEMLVSASCPPDSSAESKMDNLYATILRACNWDNKEFAESCRTLLGAVVAAKSPLTLRALNALYQRVLMGSERALRQLSPLLTGLSNEPTDQPVRFLHLSLRDFLTSRAASMGAPSSNDMFAMDEEEHNRTLALLCLVLLNTKLDVNMPGVGYCSNTGTQSSGIPLVYKREVPPELMYACRFWVDHLLDTEAPMPADLVEQLEHFLVHKVTLWMEFIAAYDRYEGLSRLQKWAELVFRPDLKQLVFSQTLAHLTHKLAERLGHMDRREEALLAARDEIAIYRNTGFQGNSSLAALARALNASVPYLRALNQQDEAIVAANEAIGIQRDLALDGSAVDLARSLYHLSTTYNDLKQPEDAIRAAEEAVQIQQSLSPDDQFTTRWNSNMALYLLGYAGCLSGLGRHQDSLLAVQRAVELRRQFANERPSEYTHREKRIHHPDRSKPIDGG